jgi:hypothetical protein
MLYGPDAVNATTGHAVPMVIEAMPVGGLRDKAGYAPERLDDTIGQLIQNAETGARLIADSTPMLQSLMLRVQHEVDAQLAQVVATAPLKEGEVPPPHVRAELAVALSLAKDISIIMERLNKMVLGSGKVLDDASRLRTFLATGDAERGGLEELGENQLKQMLLDAVSGWQAPTTMESPTS